ncbi:hypothetical protein GCK72_001457 [Caenorhabditis remanei]|uniref:Uncharacterized protein n=1 Tax=Caenorhabditis remanei TaxID=31234 RepID=A0A6A5HN09_CAERE|nr:hypothetical protein GCK72_001457 [Caenorhabditis remanei]KAF1769640.1 hypothetical protein GCK72_001457 [Caenorhabditis remanei]
MNSVRNKTVQEVLAILKKFKKNSKKGEKVHKPPAFALSSGEDIAILDPSRAPLLILASSSFNRELNYSVLP